MSSSGQNNSPVITSIVSVLDPDKVTSTNIPLNSGIANFGYTTAINNSGILAVSAYYDGTGNIRPGAVHVHTPNSSGGYDVVELTASDGEHNDYLGLSVAINDNGVVVASAYGDDDNGNAAGAIYVFTPDGIGGYAEVKLTASDAAALDFLGRGEYTVSVNNAGVVVAGAYGDDDKGSESGSIYVFTPDGSGGYNEVKLTASDGAAGDQFGQTLVVNDAGIIAVGTYNDGDNGADSGSVYVYTPNGTGGYTEVKLTASDGAAGDQFGRSVAINESGIMIAGSPFDDDGGSNSGSLYVYTPDGIGGYSEVKLTASDAVASDFLGYSVAMNEAGVVVAGALGNDDNGSYAGAAYVFRPDGAGGYTETKLLAPDGEAGDNFGRSVSINDAGVVLVGAYHDDDHGLNSGAVYTFTPDALGNYVPTGDLNLWETTTTANITGSLDVTFSDQDVNDTGYTASVTAVSKSGTTGGLSGVTDAALLNLISITDIVKAAGSSTGSLKVNFAANSTLFDYLATEETVTLTYTLAVNDPNSGTASQTFNVTIVGTNDAPVALAVTGTANEDGPVVTITANYSDIDVSDTHTITVDTTATVGSVTNNTNGTFSYSADEQFEYLAAGETATDTFTYTVSDGNGGTATETVTVTITGQNDAPVALAVAAAANEDGPAITVSASITDADTSDTHTYTVDTTGTIGSVTNNNDGTFSYSANGQFEYLAAGETATDTFTYTVSDGNGGTATETVTVTITGQNDAPVALAVTAAANENGPAITVSASITDADTSDTHTYTVNTTGTTGSVTNNNNGTFSYSTNGQFDYLAAGETATDTFTYTVSDGNGGTATETVTITIAGENRAPLITSIVSVLDPDKVTSTNIPLNSGIANFGYTTAINNSGILAVSAYYDGTGNIRPGAVHVHTPNNSGGYDVVELTASDGEHNDYLGLSVAINDNGVVVASAYGDDDNGNAAGAIYVFTPDGIGGYAEVKLTASDAAALDFLGRGEYTVSVNNAGVVVAGAYGDDDKGSESGSIYVFTPDGSGGYNEVKLTASDGAAGDQFGQTLVVNDAGIIAVGTYNDGDNGADSGSVYVYTPNGTGGYTEVKLTASDGAAGDQFGRSVAINESGIMIAGSPFDDDGGSNSGSLYVYTPDGIGGYSEVKLTASDAVASDFLGYSVAMNEAGVVVAGALGNDDNGANAGAIYIYRPDGSGGYTETKLHAPDGEAGDNFGRSVSINDAGVVLVGAYHDDDHGLNSGAVYTFTPDALGNYVPTGDLNLWETTTTANITGSLDVTFSDQDVNDTGYTASVTAVSKSGTTGGLSGVTDAALLNLISITDIVKAAGSSTGSLKVNFAANSTLFDYLATEETVTLTYTLAVNDPNSGTASQTFNVTIVGTNDAPVALAVTGTAIDNGPAIILSAARADPDTSDTHTFAVDTANTKGTVINNNDGTFSYSADEQFVFLAAGETATDTFTYTISDGNGGTATETVTITVQGVLGNGVIDGTVGADTLTSTNEDEILTGFADNDTFQFKGNDFGQDTIADFEAGQTTDDVIEFDSTTFANFAEVLAAAADDGTHTTLTVDTNNSVTLKNVQVADLHADDFRFV